MAADGDDEGDDDGDDDGDVLDTDAEQATTGFR
jgi:hypothetical protein